MNNINTEKIENRAITSTTHEEKKQVKENLATDNDPKKDKMDTGEKKDSNPELLKDSDEIIIEDIDATREIRKEISQFIVSHYHRNMFWIIMMGFAAIIAEGNVACIVFLYITILLKVVEVFGLYIFNYPIIYCSHIISCALVIVSFCLATDNLVKL